MDYSDFPDEEEIPSKTQRKKEAHAQQELGATLTRLSPAVLDTLPISDSLRAAIDEFNRIPHKRGAVKRQLQYIGRLIRDCDTDAITAALEQQAQANHPDAGNQRKEQAEQYCELILQKGDQGIQTVLEECPQLDRQQLRQLYLNIQRASEEARPAAVKKLTAFLLSA